MTNDCIVASGLPVIIPLCIFENMPPDIGPIVEIPNNVKIDGNITIILPIAMHPYFKMGIT